MTDDPIPEITDLQNRKDEAELRAIAQRVCSEHDEYDRGIVKDLRIQVAQLQVMVCELKRDFVPYGRSIRWLAIGITACLVIIVKLLFW